jgi:hypothetical protein
LRVGFGHPTIICGGGFAVSEYAAFAFRKTPDSKIFLERRRVRKNRGGSAAGSLAAGVFS